MSKIFVSYNHSDYETILSILYKLKSNRNAFFFAPVDVKPGSNWTKEIGEELSKSEYVLFFLGSHGVADFQEAELAAAISQGIKAIPVLLPGVNKSDVYRSMFANIQWLDLSTGGTDIDYETLSSTINLLKDERKKKTVNYVGYELLFSFLATIATIIVSLAASLSIEEVQKYFGTDSELTQIFLGIFALIIGAGVVISTFGIGWQIYKNRITKQKYMESQTNLVERELLESIDGQLSLILVEGE
jgi:hypothetical protein